MITKTRSRRARRAVALVGTVAALASVTAATPVHAAPGGTSVVIVAHTDFTTEASEFDSSLEGCTSGTVVNAGDNREPAFTWWGGVFVGEKVFTCDDGVSGFTIRLKARFGPDGSTGTWNFTDGRGAFSGIKGSGSLVGIPVSQTILDDIYAGLVR